MLILLALLTAHFLGDFVCQSDWMAINKSTDLRALGLHASAYTAVVGIVATPHGALTAVGFGLATWLTHFATDFVTSRITSRLWFFEMQPLEGLEVRTGAAVWGPTLPLRRGLTYPANRWDFLGRVKPGYRHWFFVVIGADQLIHAWTLAATWAWVMR